MKPDTRTVKELFELDVRYLVPLYQRSYVWDEKTQWQPLWEDIEALLEHRLNGGGQFLSHFLGAIVLEQELHAPGSIPLFTIIDGQQRLTTLQLLIAAANRVALENGVEKEASILSRLTQNDELTAEGQELFKVWPTNSNRVAFGAVMQSGGPPADREDDPTNRIDEAYAFFCTAIREWLDDSSDAVDRTERMKNLRITISDLLKVVSITLEPGENAQIIFETLNARGTPLLALDLVKNAVFHSAERQGLNTDLLYHEEWQPELDQAYWRTERRQGRLYRSRADLFLMNWLAMKLHEVVPANELFASFRQRILGVPVPPRADDLIRELRRDAQIMRSFDDQPPGSAEEHFFERLELLDTTVILPVVLLLFRDRRITPDCRRRALGVLESWLARRGLMRLTVKNYNEQVPMMLRRVAADPEHADQALLSHLSSNEGDISRWPNDAELTDYLMSRPMYGSVGPKKIVMALAAAEQSLDTSKIDIPTIPKTLSLEHVLPQSWEQHWPVPDNQDPIDFRERRESYVHRLGNLTLVAAPMNTALSNSEWGVKRIELNRQAKLLLNTELIESYPDLFDEKSIDERSALLAARICAIWPRPAPPAVAVTSDQSETAEISALSMTAEPTPPKVGGDAETSPRDSETTPIGQNASPTIGEMQPGEPGDIKDRFWKELLDRDKGRAETRAGESVPARSRTKMNAGGGSRGFYFKYAIASHAATVELYIDLRSEDANRQAFAALREHRTSIESAFGDPLGWEQLEGTRARRIVRDLGPGGYEDVSRWPEIQEHMIGAMARLRQTLRPHVDAIVEVNRGSRTGTKDGAARGD